MNRSTQFVVVLALAALIASPLAAADKKKKPAREGKRPDAIGRMLSKIELTEEQTKKVAEIKEKYAEKLAAARKEMAGTLTPEQRKARAEAMKQAKADGKNGKEARQAVQAAVNLTAEQKEGIAKAQASMKEVVGKVRSELKEVLTQEQAKAAGLNRGAKGEKKPGEKKPAGEKKKKAAANE